MNSRDEIRVIAADASKNEAVTAGGLSSLLLVGLVIVLLVSIRGASGI